VSLPLENTHIEPSQRGLAVPADSSNAREMTGRLGHPPSSPLRAKKKRASCHTPPFYRRENLTSLHFLGHPALRANPFPEVTDLICRLPLPTFFYRLEAAHLGDLMRLSVRPGVLIPSLLLLRERLGPTRIFTDRQRGTGHR
jgi:hypothetical protein